uniref:Uncharacterized protein n=1 Tax=Arundo donax TaxID=35708 RepID=A0A0A9CJH4_ARUDO
MLTKSHLNLLDVDSFFIYAIVPILVLYT